MSRISDVIVVGGGVIGCASAWFLAREGLSVTLLERGQLAERASGANAGMLLPFGETNLGGPFLAWGLRSLALFAELCAELRERSGIDPEFEASGALHVAFDAEAALRLRAKAERFAEHGLRWLDGDDLRSQESSLARELVGGVWSPLEAHVRPPLLTRALAAAAADLGAHIERGVTVTAIRSVGRRVVGVETTDGSFDADHVVASAGAWTPALLSRPLPIEPLRGQLAILDLDEPMLRTIVVGAPAYLVPKRDGSLVIGATEERVGFDNRVTSEGMRGLLAGAEALAPRLGQAAFRRGWAGLRPATPDGLPLLGPSPDLDGLVIAAGHTRNGVLLGPITGQLVRDLILGKDLSDEARAFSLDRFA